MTSNMVCVSLLLDAQHLIRIENGNTERRREETRKGTGGGEKGMDGWIDR